MDGTSNRRALLGTVTTVVLAVSGCTTPNSPAPNGVGVDPAAARSCMDRHLDQIGQVHRGVSTENGLVSQWGFTEPGPGWVTEYVDEDAARKAEQAGVRHIRTGVFVYSMEDDPSNRVVDCLALTDPRLGWTWRDGEVVSEQPPQPAPTAPAIRDVHPGKDTFPAPGDPSPAPDAPARTPELAWLEGTFTTMMSCHDRSRTTLSRSCFDALAARVDDGRFVCEGSACTTEGATSLVHHDFERGHVMLRAKVATGGHFTATGYLEHGFSFTCTAGLPDCMNSHVTGPPATRLEAAATPSGS